jgi:DNA-binding HxlR family transcriptional regulator
MGETVGMRVLPDPPSALQRAVDRVGDRWVLLIVAALLEGPMRFGELADGLGVAPNILTQRLRQMEADGVLVASRYQERPPRSSYALTEVGRELAGAVGQLREWGARHEGEASGSFHHRCGTAVETRPWCPTCDRVVEADEYPSSYDA